MRLLRSLRLLEETVKVEQKRRLQEALTQEAASSEKLYGILLRLGPLLSSLWSQAALAAHEEALTPHERQEAKVARDELLKLMMTSVSELPDRLGALETFLQAYSGKAHIFYAIQEKLLRSIIDELQKLYSNTPRSLMLVLTHVMASLEQAFRRNSIDSGTIDELSQLFERCKLRLSLQEGAFAGGLLSELLSTITKKAQVPPEVLEEAHAALELHALIEGYEPLTAPLARRLYTQEPQLQRNRLHHYLVGHYADASLF